VARADATVSATSKEAGIEQVRTVLFGAERDALVQLGHRVDDLAHLSTKVDQHHAALQPLSELQVQITQQLEQLREHHVQLQQQLTDLEELVGTLDGRTEAVSEVLVGAVSTVGRDVGVLGGVLKPEVEHALHDSARVDSTILAEALYPVMGPAMRKMIANLFTADPGGGELFVVSELLLIERSSGVLLASSSSSISDENDSDIVSGMLDAIRLFVEEAFDSPEHDGLRDLRVGDTSVLVEWGPKAILASVVKGVPTNDYRHAAAETLERLHLEHAQALENFDGRIHAFAPASVSLDALRKGATPRMLVVRRHPVAFAALAIVVLILVVVLLIVVF